MSLANQAHPSAPPLFNEPLAWDAHLLASYDLAGPRYTSYPTAPQFNESFSQADYAAAAERSNASGRPLSLYCHIPFCETLCFYCGCNKVITPNKERAMPYLEQMALEMTQVKRWFEPGRLVEQLHWGGGTPSYLSDLELEWLINQLRSHFHLRRDDGGDYGIEIHPGRTAARSLLTLRRLGFNRLSMGVQDFDPAVQAAVNRYNTPEEVGTLVRVAREQGFHSINMDLIYGLPLQTPEGFGKTLEQVIQLRPDRLSVFSYAHLPHLFKSQKLIHDQDLPSAETKLGLLRLAIEKLQGAGYVYVGMDHFALPEDSLVKAQAEGRMQRNFQGYATHGDCDLVSLGVSAISHFGDAYVQNAKHLIGYQQRLEAGDLAFVRGFVTSAEDRLRRYVIGQLICHFQLNFAELKRLYAVDAQTYFAAELAQLGPMMEDGLLSLDDQGIRVHNAGRLLIRRLCMVFDAYLNQGNQIRYSRVI